MPRLSIRILLCLALLVVCKPLLAAADGPRNAPSYKEALSALGEGQSTTARIVLSRGGDPVLNKVLRGLLMAQAGNDFTFDEMASFIADHPDWPGLKGILMIAEQKLPESASARQIANWFSAYPALTLAGFYRHIDALETLGEQSLAASLIRARWIEKDFSTTDSTAFRSRFGSVLRTADHIARLDRLLWANNSAGAKAMLPLLPPAYQALADARLALANQSSNVEALVARVPVSLSNDPGLLYERLRWRRRNNNDQSAIDILLQAPKELGNPEEWWMERHIMARRMMERKDFRLAYRLVQNHGLSSGFDFVQAEFLAGWLALRFLKRPELAENHFRAILSESSSPISRARGYYWLGRSLEAKNRIKEAREAYEYAGALHTTFYGQIALTRLSSAPVIRASTEPSIPPAIRQAFFGRDIVKATEKLYQLGLTDRARQFFRAACDSANQRIEFALLLELAYELQRPDWAVQAAKAANQKNFIVTGAAYPVLSIKIPSPPDPAFTHALIRQESLFKADAGSPAGARGLMQLMPGTAKDVARKLGLPYSPDRLTDPDYNLKLGTTFIQNQIDSFDGSYIVALAGYNAGPRRAREWMETYGDPRTGAVDPVDWIELIPIYETRNYVQRIIENLQFYRARLNGGEAPLRITEDLKR